MLEEQIQVGLQRCEQETQRCEKRGGQPGNKNATGPPGNKNAEKYGFFSKFLPDETREIFSAIDQANPLDLLWHQIQIAYSAIIRAQQIMYVHDREDKTIEKVEEKSGNVYGESWEVQQAWDKQANFLKAQARAQGELRQMIEAENTPKTYAGKEYTTYEALQQQRKMETAMRATRQKIKLLQEGGAPDTDVIIQKAKYQGQMQAYKDFSQKMKLPEQKQRIMQDGLRGKFMPTKTENKLFAQKVKHDKIIKELRDIGVRGEIHYPSRAIDTNSLAFDEKHINQQREHGVTLEEAKEYIKNAKVSVTVWKGQYERYYGDTGTAYVDLANKLVRTAYKRAEYKGDVLKILEVMKGNE